MPIPLSIVIIAKNEERQIKECLDSVYGWADEIIVVDDESTDNTKEIVKKFTDKIFTRHMELEGKQRNFGVSKTKNDWVMMLDCDERVTDGLKKEIENILKKNDSTVVAYWIPQINYLGHVHLKHGGWAAPHVRLYKKANVRWREVVQDIVHPGIIIDPSFQGGNLKEYLIHYNYANIQDFVKKVNRQSSLEAIKWYLSKKKMNLTIALWRMVDRFFRRFIGKGGYKDGFYGFVAAILSGLYEIIAYAKLVEIRERQIYLKEYGVNLEDWK